MTTRRTLLYLPPALFAAIAILFFTLSALFPLPPPKPYSPVIRDRRGEFLSASLSPDGIWRLRTSPDEIPDKLKRILILREDRYFFTHPGVNPYSMFRAVARNIRAGRIVSGASTITMQVARMLEPKERTYLNKLVEVFRAFQLELRYSKKEILEIYLSMVPLGGNVEGLKSASLLYYRTPPERLNIAQLLDLTLIQANPNALRPDRNPEKLESVRRQQAARWIRRGLLTREDSLVIWQTPAAATRRGLESSAPHFCLRVLEKYPGETDLRTSLDLRTQKTAESLLSHHLAEWKRKGVMNGAVLIVDNATREVVAYVGSEDFGDAAAQGQFDAVKAIRSPGSTLKPFLYALNMDEGVLTPKTRLLDTPYDAEGYLAENYDGKYAGLVYADEALRRSLNVPMIRLLKSTGIPKFLSFMENAGISSLEEERDRLGLSLIAGGCGVSLEELTGAYAAIPNGGIYLPPAFLRNEGGRAQRQAFSPSAAYMVSDILSGLDRPDIPNNFESSLNLPKVAFKTGTSYGRRDAWAIGYSAEFTAGVWVGNVSDRGNPELTGSRAAAPILIDLFNSLSSAGQKSILPMPRDLQVREVCANSGLLPTRSCSHLIDDYFSVRRTLNRRCEIDREVLVSVDGSMQYCPSCLGSHGYRVAAIEEYPPDLLTFWDGIDKPYSKPPPHNPDCNRLYAGEGPSIVSPSPGMTYFIFSPEGRLSFQANSAVEVQEHAWYLDSRYLGRRKSRERFLVPVGGGNHTITCVDDRGRTSSVKIIVKNAL